MVVEPDPASHRQLRQWVADRLRSDILEGRLQPGQWLRQQHLAAAHGVSQTPVREALKQLAAEGLVEHVPYRGIRVVTLSVEDVEDLYTCRAAVESVAARHAAAAVTADELEQLRSLCARMSACAMPAELGEYRRLNRRFHELVSAAGRRSYLLRTITQLWAAFPTMLWSNVPRTAQTSAPGRDEPDAAEHAEILAALEARDPDRAEAAVRRHIQTAGRTLAAAMRGPP